MVTADDRETAPVKLQKNSKPRHRPPGSCLRVVLPGPSIPRAGPRTFAQLRHLQQ